MLSFKIKSGNRTGTKWTEVKLSPLCIRLVCSEKFKLRRNKQLKKERQIYLTNLISSCSKDQENIRMVLLEVKECKGRKENIKSMAKFTVGEL